METPTDGDRDEGFAGLIVACDAEQYYAIGWDDLQPFLVPAAWAAAVAVLVRGEEPAGGEEDVCGLAADLALTAGRALLIEAATEMRRTRLAAQRLAAWALLR